jgi:hypothetical protein
LQVHHTCHNRLCCNVDHMQLLTVKEHAALHYKPTHQNSSGRFIARDG